MGAFLTSVFLGAFLLFQLQPIIARFILPWYGGTPALWTACMMFFQAALLLGYLYAHLLASRVPAKRQPVIHLTLLACSLLLLPVGVPESWEPMADGHPAVEILVLLAISVGIPFVLVSASGPLLQHWFAGVHRDKSPFRLYALSNAGSLAALLTYPVLVEPYFRIDTQAQTWSVLYVVLVAAFAVCGIAFANRGAAHSTTAASAQSNQPVSLRDRILWISLAACGSTLLLATTNKICQDIAVVPFLWILPLSLYLVSFIICFDKDAWYKRSIWMSLAGVGLVLQLRLLFMDHDDEWTLLTEQIFIYSLALFACCMVCHGELARRRSAVPQLTTFYLYVSLGGAIGGVFVNLIAPYLFSGYWELHIGMAATVILAGICIYIDGKDNEAMPPPTVFVPAWSSAVVILVVALVIQAHQGRDHTIYVERGFFGVVSVEEVKSRSTNHERKLYHGNVQHGRQFLNKSRQHVTGSYYGVSSGAAMAIKQHPRRVSPDQAERGLRIGIVGLGVGTLSAEATDKDYVRYYEINPQVEMIANRLFLYLQNSRAKNDVVLGDARISLERELRESGSNQFDVLILDAFSGDAVPVHLLTGEAFDLYSAHMREGGIIAFHVTNAFLDLGPVIHGAAQRIGMESLRIEDDARRTYENTNQYILVTKNRSFLDSPKLTAARIRWNYKEPDRILWTDDFSNLLQIVYWEG